MFPLNGFLYMFLYLGGAERMQRCGFWGPWGDYVRLLTLDTKNIDCKWKIIHQDFKNISDILT